MSSVLEGNIVGISHCTDSGSRSESLTVPSNASVHHLLEGNELGVMLLPALFHTFQVLTKSVVSLDPFNVTGVGLKVSLVLHFWSAPRLCGYWNGRSRCDLPLLDDLVILVSGEPSVRLDFYF